MKQLVLIAHNLRSTHNVGSLLRTADGLGLTHVYLTGYTPYPAAANDPRMPHEAAKLSRQIQKTALGAEVSQSWSHKENIDKTLEQLRTDGYFIVALEQTNDSQPLTTWQPAALKVAVIVGREVEGLEPDVVAQADVALEIPMLGQKESFNVSIAAAMALFYLRFAKQ